MWKAFRLSLVPDEVKRQLVVQTARLGAADTCIQSLAVLIERLGVGGEDASRVRQDALATIALYNNTTKQLTGLLERQP